MFQGLIELMYFVDDREAAARWYADLFGATVATLASAPGALFVRVGGQEVWFHQADRKVPAGAAGQVAYWRVNDFDAVLARAQAQGGLLYRGPLDRRDGLWMCQVKDPFGNLIGLIGPRPAQQ